LPVKRYSSGMYVRLAFAVAAHLDPEILLVDEVLAVGDQTFQKKCLGKMSEMTRSGRTVLLVSHNMAAIQNLCRTCLVLDHGRLKFLGETEEAVRLYVAAESEANEYNLDLTSHPGRPATCTPIFQRLRLLNANGEPGNQILCGDSLILEVTLLPIAHPNLQVVINFEDVYSDRLFRVSTRMVGLQISPGSGERLRCRIPEMPLLPGRYYLTLQGGVPGASLDRFERVAYIDVNPSDFFGSGRIPGASAGRFLVRHEWQTMDEICPQGLAAEHA
jgi:lipopolysaccharide transport system ATP-binding protein